ncbi:hypothetical protein LCGC14_2711110, partial [marine sediment metagenome]
MTNLLDKLTGNVMETLLLKFRVPELLAAQDAALSGT